MSLEAKFSDGNEQSLLEAQEWPRRVAGDNRSSADAVAGLVRARMPAPQDEPQGDGEAAKAPPLQPDQSDQHAEGRSARRGSFMRRHALTLGLLLTIPAAAAGHLYWDYSSHFESTDDAFIAARAFSIQPKVAGYITAVPVTDNQHVAAGDVIARIDDRDYRAALDQAKGQLAHDQSLLDQARRNLSRYQTLGKTNSIAQQQVDDQSYLVDQDKATVALDQANLDTAQLNLSHTAVTADQAGRVVNLTAAVGQFAQAGTTLTMFVPDEIWVTANFKETQLDRMRPEQPVTLKLDAYPEHTIRGHVASVQPGSGTAFSLLPAQNATGNYVKIVQRVPVKIVIDNPPADLTLGPGMSVVPTVEVDASPSLYQRLVSSLHRHLGGQR
jgi:membrane fusion protein, multidrug efflux system